MMMMMIYIHLEFAKWQQYKNTNNNSQKTNRQKNKSKNKANVHVISGVLLPRNSIHQVAAHYIPSILQCILQFLDFFVAFLPCDAL